MGKQITQEEFLNRLYKKTGFNIELKSNYIGSNKKVKFICPYCYEEHESLAQSIMRGYFCRHNIGRNNPNLKNTETFKQEVFKVDSSVKIIGKYKNANTPIEAICSCGEHFYKAPGQMLLGYTKCKKCTMHRFTFLEIKEIVLSKHNNVIFDDKYKKYDIFTKTNKLDYICECGKHCSSRIQHLINGGLCASCSSPRNKSHKTFVKEMKNINSKIKIIGTYHRVDSPIKYQCECGNIDYTTPHSLLKGVKCHVCAGNKKKTTSEFIEELKNINPKIIVIGEYINAETPIEYMCECGKRHSSAPSLLLNGHRCGECNMSKSEYITDGFLEKNNIEHYYDYKFNDCINKYSLKFDFFLPEYNTCIELDGEHHFMPVNFRGIDNKRANERHKYTKKLDAIKDNYCREKRINLIRIPYWNFDNIENILSNHINTLKKAN